MKVYADIIYKAEFELPDTSTEDDAYDMAVAKLRECRPDKLDINLDICKEELQ